MVTVLLMNRLKLPPFYALPMISTAQVHYKMHLVSIEWILCRRSKIEVSFITANPPPVQAINSTKFFYERSLQLQFCKMELDKSEWLNQTISSVPDIYEWSS